MKKLSYMKKIFIFIFLVVSILAISLNFKVKAAVAAVGMVWTHVGEDASTQEIVAWHSNFNTGTLYVTLDADTTFKNATTYAANGVFDNTSYEYDKVSFYEFEVHLSDLTPDTVYRYRIKCGTVTSDAKTFKTAGNSGNFGFLWFGDNHAYKVDSCTTRYTYLNNITSALDKAGKDYSFVMCTGDTVSYGGSYDNYEVLNTKVNMFSHVVYAPCPGNHDYYGSHNQYPDSSVNIDNRFYESVYAHPVNGFNNPMDSSYWYIYNSILFIALDSLAAGYSHTLVAQKEWFEKVVNMNQGRYQYLIVYQHYPWMNALTGEHSGPYTSNFKQWYQLFDKYAVDLALGGDHHVYYRSKFIYDDQVVEDGSKGTMYVGCPQIGDRYRTITDRKDPEYYAIRIDDVATDPNALANYSGCTYYTVTPNGITGELMDTTGAVKDTYTIPARRAVKWTDKKDQFISSLQQSFANGIANIDFAPSYSEYISKIKVMDAENKLIASVLPAKNKAYSIKLENLEANKVYNLKLVVEYVDGTSKTFNYACNTYAYYGSIDSFKATVNDNKLLLSWNQDLKNDVISKYRISRNGTALETINATSSSYEITKADTNLSASYTLEALTSSDDVVFTQTIYYNLFGDVNFDGSVNKDDVSSLFTKIQNQYQFEGNEKAILDLNEDGKVDIGDAILIYEYANKEIESMIKSKLFTVTILDKNGNIISTQRVAFGADAVLPTITDTNFLYYTNNGKYITQDLIIRPVYQG